MRVTLDRSATSAEAIAASSNAAVQSEAARWALALARQCRIALDELTYLAPWITLPAAPSGVADLPDLDAIPNLRELAGLEATYLPGIERRSSAEPTPEGRGWLADLVQHITQAGARARARIAAIESLALLSSRLASMEYGFLYDKGRHLLSIGYSVGDLRRDSSYYDLLASEARLCSFVAIAQGQVPQENWFALGRLLTGAGGEPVLLSWSGSMFEYLMPLLVMPTYQNTLLDQTCRAAVDRQIDYGKQRGVPWGMSESGYNTVDVALNYQYRAFGVPGLGLKRGLAEDLVIAPYASVLALTVAPEEACANLQRLAAEGLAGTFGLFEAVDYTPSRLPRGHSKVVVRSFMAHHQGMSLLALAHLLRTRPMQKRFESDPLFQATMLLLQERVPKSRGAVLARRRAGRDASELHRTGSARARAQQPCHPDSGGPAVVQRPLPRDGHERGWRLQPLEGPGRHALARRHHLRRLGHVLLPARCGQRSVLVDSLPADPATGRALRSDLLGGPCGVPAA